MFIYMDDFSTTGPSQEECWQGAEQVGSRLSWFGFQNASKKRTEASQLQGPWAGTILHTDGVDVMALVDQKKWEKTQNWVAWLQSYTEEGKPLPHKELERCRGFLIYVSRTYKAMIPYLRGLYLTLESWRDWRNEDGWKLPLREIKTLIEAMGDHAPLPVLFKDLPLRNGKCIDIVKAAPRLRRDDVEAMSKLVSAKIAPKVVRRSRKVVSAHYGARIWKWLGYWRPMLHGIRALERRDPEQAF